MTKKRLALDLGGTKLVGAVVPGNGPGGEILPDDILRPESDAGTREGFLRAVGELRDQARSELDLIGIAAPGDIHRHTYVGTSPNLPWLRELDLGELVHKELGVRTQITNDMEAAGIGEALQGLGKTYRRFWLFTFSTGIGGVLVVDGKVVGKEKGGGEPGHVTLIREPGAPLCGCGRRGCWEAVASGGATRRRLLAIRDGKEKLPVPFDRLLAETADDPSPCLDRAAAEGEEWALGIYGDVAYWMGHALSDIVNCTGPDAIVYMGTFGILAMRFLQARIREILRERVMSAALREIPIVPSTTIVPGKTVALNALYGAVAALPE